MENEKDYSLDRSVEVEKIIDFYKDIDNTVDTPEEKEEKQDNIYIKKVLELLNKSLSYVKNTSIYKKFAPKSEDPKSDEIKSLSFGLSENGRAALYHLISLVVCVLIIVISVILTIVLPGNKLKIEEKENELRNHEEYVSLKSRHTSIKTEIDEITASNKEKKGLLNQISDVENTKADIRLQIEERKRELNELNMQIAAKRATVSELDSAISAKTPAEKIYTPGKYTAGAHIAAGKYLVSGTGKFMVASAAGKSKINVTLNSTPLEIVLEERDVVKFDSKVKFVSVY